jgi:hypothetical protein
MWDGEHREAVRLLLDGRKRLLARLIIEFRPGRSENALCKVDTGADKTTIPRWIWSQYMSDAAARRGRSVNVSGVGGAIEGFEHRLPLRLLGMGNSTPLDLGDCDVLLAFDEAAGTKRGQVLPGLGGGTLDKGGLCINWKERHFWFVEVR